MLVVTARPGNGEREGMHKKAVEDSVQIDQTRHGGMSLHSASLSQSHGHDARHGQVMSINCHLED